MSKKELTNGQKKEWAQLLFLQNDLNQRSIAEKVGVSEVTMSNWVTKGNWDKLRKSLLTTKSEILRRIYDHLDKISLKLQDAKEGDPKQADAFVKYTASINNLETETSVGSIIEVGRMFVNYIQNEDPQLAVKVLNYIDALIKEKLKRF